MQKLQGSAPNLPGMLGGGMGAPGMPPAVRPMGMMGGGALGGGMSNLPSNIIVLHGMFNPSQVNLANDPEFFHDIEADVEQECRKYGSVSKVWPDQASSRGDVWVRFADVTSSANCQRALDRRWFAGQQIIAEFTSESAWAATVKARVCCCCCPCPCCRLP